MNVTPGTVVQAAGLTGFPFALVVMGVIALAAAAVWCFIKKRRSTATMLVGGALVLLYLLWNVWPVLVIGLVTIVAGVIPRLSIFDRLRRAGQAFAEPVGGTVESPAPTTPPADAE